MATFVSQKNGYSMITAENPSPFGTAINFKYADSQDGNIHKIFLDTEEGFSNSFNYYIEGTISKHESAERKIKIYLLTLEQDSKFDIATLNIGTGKKGSVDLEPFKIALRPGKASYKWLVFENIQEDLAPEQRQYDLNIGTVLQLNNIFTGEKIIQLGLQADPGFIFILNGEPMKVGRRGFFETPDGYEITDVAVSNENFVIDYKYKVEGVL